MGKPSPPFNGGTHTCLPLPGRDLLVLNEAVLDDYEDGFKPMWVFDIRDKLKPINIATYPGPDDADCRHKGGHFGPHNLYENRPDSLVSERAH